ncbi:NAD(P)/FAD-dependent oxidoreductase [Brytella acorum]|uniref:FAD-binding oxidoreductase n=1 Tax=Brytella acorum TaxID=2959299 RepID=A0AA35UVG8_9PROT|nr:FAD-binding oxidoreductase [Brytella acorum]MDF3623363.1 FAD-binding oxidoreductase [Brytella acorum]CAI9120442.1 FAD-binding oxidoreductase [Brytella acorum]
MTSAIIIGGGVIGRACALSLLDRGCAVTLVADADPAPASWGNAGHIATEQVTPLAEWATIKRLATDLFPRGPVALDWRRPGIWLPWSLRFLRACAANGLRRVSPGETTLRDLLSDALPAWERLAQRLGQPELLDKRGIVKLFEKDDAPIRAARMIGTDWGTARACWIEPAERALINARFRAPIREAVHFPGTAHVTDPRLVLDGLLASLIAAGGQHHTGYVTGIETHGDGVRVRTDAGVLEADRVIVAGGVRSGLLLPDLALPMIAERGYHVEWDHNGEWTGPNVVFEDRAVVVTRFGSRLRATSFVEFSAFDAPPDPRKWEHLERHVREMGLPVHGPFARWHGARPTLPDYLPALGALPDQPHVFAVCGHNHLGLTLAATTAERLTRHMLDGAPLPHTLRPGRFSKNLRCMSFPRRNVS